MSGHFATLLRGTIRTLLRDHQVFVTDWINPRNVRFEDGNFALEDYTQHCIDFIGFIGEDCHWSRPASRRFPRSRRPRRLAQERTVATLEPHPDGRADRRSHRPDQGLRARAGKADRMGPLDYDRHRAGQIRGRGPVGYPGFLQLCAFMSMNADPHTKSFVDLFHHRVAGDIEKADAIRDFYKEYFAIMDMSADLYLETVEQVFQRHLLPQGLMKHRGRSKSSPRAIKKTFLLTVEGEKDDICAVGQTLAAQDLCSSLRPYMKIHHLQAGVGHYGVFNGKRWETQVYPVLRNHIQASR